MTARRCLGHLEAWGGRGGALCIPQRTVFQDPGQLWGASQGNASTAQPGKYCHQGPWNPGPGESGVGFGLTLRPLIPAKPPNRCTTLIKATALPSLPMSPGCLSSSVPHPHSGTGTPRASHVCALLSVSKFPILFLQHKIHNL